VFAGGVSLYEQRRAYGAKVQCFPSGVEPERFAVDVAPHPLTALRGGPICGYVGVIDERLDYGLIAALAEVFSDGHLLLVGPVVKVDPRLLPQRANVHFPGRLAYNALPSILSGCDVALMPFALNRATASISPTKTLEYFAAGRPVVSTPIADVERSYGDIAYVAPAIEPFVEAVREALAVPPGRLARGLAAAQAQTWDAIFARMWAEISE
jgi:glycosyltransferase involved in cell wall biosynthesis